MSCKAIILLTRRADQSHDDFASWWLGEHAPLARRLPGVRRAVFNLVDQPADGDPDGVSELWFDSRDDFTAAYATEIGQAVVATPWRTSRLVSASSSTNTPSPADHRREREASRLTADGVRERAVLCEAR